MEKDKKELLDNFLRLDPENQAHILARIRTAYTAQIEREVRQSGLVPATVSTHTTGGVGYEQLPSPGVWLT